MWPPRERGFQMRKTTRRAGTLYFASLAIAAMMGILGAGEAQALLINGDFETGDLTGWTTFTTANGTLGVGLPQVVVFDTTNTGAPSNSASFNVGQIVFQSGGPGAGGGIFQNVNLFDGSLSISADIAVLDNVGFDNQAGGLFELLLDGVVVDSHDFGFVFLGIAEFNMLADISGITAGSHQIAIRMTRPFGSNLAVSPTQFIDNISLGGTALVPEPNAVLLFGVGTLLVGGAVRRRRT